MARLSEFLLQGPSPVCSYRALLLLLGIALVVVLVVRKNSGPCRAEVRYGGRKYRVPGVFDNTLEAERARDLLILVMHQLGIIPASSSRVPALQHPRSSYYLPGLAVLRITNDMRVRLAQALDVSESTINKIACISAQHEARVSTTVSDDGRVAVEVTTRDGIGYAFNRWTLCNAEQMGFVPDDWNAYHRDMLFIAFANIMPRSFHGCIWDVEQHAKSQAEPGMLMRYEYMPYFVFLRRLVVQHVVGHWEVFKQFAQADHANALPEYVPSLARIKFEVAPMTSSADYQEWMTTHYWCPGRCTEALALCDLFQCCACVIDADQSCMYQLYPPSVEPIEGNCIYLYYSSDRQQVFPLDRLQVLPMLPCTTADAMAVTGWSLPLLLPLEMLAAQEAQSSSSFQRKLWPFAYSYINDTPNIPLVCLAMPSVALPDASQANRHTRPVPWTGEPNITWFSFDSRKKYSGHPFGRPLAFNTDSGIVAFAMLCVGHVETYPGVFQCASLSDDSDGESEGRYWSDSETEDLVGAMSQLSK